MSYSFIGFQTAYVAIRWNPIYWNTACLVVNSGSLEDEEFEEDENGDVIKKKEKTADYSKIAKALGDILSRKINISLVDINKSDFSFKPDAENNQILFGMKALSHINTEIIEQIKRNRPYSNFKDFLNKCNLNKSAMISLIKSGAFDNLEKDWAEKLKIEPRVLIMTYYLSKACEPKTRITLQNFNGLIQKNLVPQNLDLQKNIFMFNKYLKENKYSNYYILNTQQSQEFYNKNFDDNELEIVEGKVAIEQKKWDKIYSKQMDIARDWIKENQQQILKELNTSLFKEIWDKYANGNISAWEMEALCFYYHEHELKNVNKAKYGLYNFNNIPDSEVDYYFKKNGKEIPIFKLYKIAGTVIAKNDVRSSISLLTPDGVVNVKFTKEYYAMANRQISQKQEDGTKKIVEKGWFTRGTKLLVTGFKREDTFVGKTYARTQTHQLYKILSIDENGNLELTHERAVGDEEDEY